jgi:putative FmdB family regulatory protein
MPIFDFTCNQCDHSFESLVLGESDRIRCPDCGSSAVLRITVSLFSCAGVQLSKQLRLDSEERMNKGRESMKKKGMRKNRIKIL